MDSGVTRRDCLRVGGAVAIGGLGGCTGRLSDVVGGGSGPAGGGTPGWQQFRHDRQNSGIGAAGPTDGFEEAWQWRFEFGDHGDGLSLHATSAPVGTADAAYVVGFAQYPQAGDRKSVLAGLDPGSGESRWTVATRTPFDRTQVFAPVVHEGVVVAGVRDELVAVDAKTGEEQWRERLDAPIGGPLTAHDGHVYVPSDVLRAIAVETGDEVWHFEGEERALPNYHPPAITDTTVFLPVNRAELVAIARDDGSERWRETIGPRDRLWGGRESVYSPVVADGRLVVATGSYLRRGRGHLFSLDPDTGSERWSFTPEPPDDSSNLIATVRKRLQNETDGETHRRLRAALAPEAFLGVYGAPVVTGGTAYLTGGNGSEHRVYAIDIGSGTVDRSEPVQRIGFQPVLADDTLYLVSQETIRAVALDSLDVRAEASLSSPVKTFRSPALLDGRLLVPVAGGLIAYE